MKALLFIVFLSILSISCSDNSTSVTYHNRLLVGIKSNTSSSAKIIEMDSIPTGTDFYIAAEFENVLKNASVSIYALNRKTSDTVFSRHWDKFNGNYAEIKDPTQEPIPMNLLVGAYAVTDARIELFSKYITIYQK